MQARFYLPMWGRFASPDPARDQHFEETQSWNIYSYVQNNPVMNTDPTGMMTWKEFWDSTKGVANGWTNSNFGVKAFSPSDTKAYRDGVVAGDVTAMLQAGHEMAAGAAATTGGTGLSVGSGGTLAEVGVPVAVGGLVLATHGVVVEGNAIANLGKDLPAALSTGSGGEAKPSTPGKMQKEVERGQAPKEVDSVHKGHTGKEEPHVHYKDGTSSTQSGGVHDKKGGTPDPSSKTREWLNKHNWGGPKRQ